MSLSLYALSADYQAVIEAAENAGTEADEQAFRDTLAGLSGEIVEKADRCAAVMATLDATAEAIKHEEQRLEARRKAIEANRSRLSDYVLMCLKDANMPKVKGARFTLQIQQNPPKVVVDEESKIPTTYWIAKPVLDRAAISQALKNGSEVPGAHLERGESLRVR